MANRSNLGGVFAVSRAIFDDPDFANEPFTQREAFMWLVASAAWKEHKTRGTRGTITLKRGEFCFAIRFLAERWQWSKSRVERFISTLKNRDTIKDTKRDGEQVYFIKKYNDFQTVGTPKRDSERDTNRDSSGTAAGQQRDKEETLKHSNIEVTSSLRSEDKARGALSILGDVLDLDRSKAVIAHRRAKKIAVTDHAITLLVTQLKACPDPNAAADEMILRGWSSVKPEWIDNANKPQAPPRKSAHVERHDEARRILEESIKARRQSNEQHGENIIDLDDRDWSPFGTIIGGRK